VACIMILSTRKRSKSGRQKKINRITLLLYYTNITARRYHLMTAAVSTSESVVILIVKAIWQANHAVGSFRYEEPSESVSPVSTSWDTR
jgi:hypothetical protein